MSHKNITHIRGLFNVEEPYAKNKFFYIYGMNPETKSKSVSNHTRSLQNNIAKFSQEHFRKRSKKHRRYNVGVQTSSSYMISDEDIDRMLNSHSKGFDMVLFPKYRRRLMSNYLRIWLDRFHCSSAHRMRKSLHEPQHPNDDFPISESDNVNFEDSDNSTNRRLRLVYESIYSGIQSVSFEEIFE